MNQPQLHVRIPTGTAEAVLHVARTENRSAAQVVNRMICGSQEWKDALANMNSQKHPRPAVSRRPNVGG